MQDFPTTIMDELEFWESIEIPGTPVRLAEGQVLEEFMLEEDIEFQGIDMSKIVELPDEQDIEIDKETVELPEMPARIAYEQEECIEEEIFDRSLPKLPKLYRAEKSVYKNEVKLEIPETHSVKINALPREVKLEMPMEQNGSKLGQDVNIDSDVPTQFHVVPSRKILGKSLPKLHIRQSKVLGSKLVRIVNTTRLVKRKIPSICRPHPKPPDRQNRLNVKVSKRILSKMYYANKERVNYRPPPMSPFIVNANREGMRDRSEKEDRVNYMPPSKPFYIVNANGEVIGIIEREDLPYVVPKPKPPPKSPPKDYNMAMASWIR